MDIGTGIAVASCIAGALGAVKIIVQASKSGNDQKKVCPVHSGVEAMINNITQAQIEIKDDIKEIFQILRAKK